MKEINKKATVPETTAIANEVVTAVTQTAINDAYLTSETNSLKGMAAAMTEGIGTDTANKYTEDCNTAEDSRDDHLTAFIYFLCAYQLWKNEPKQAAANRLHRIVENHGGNFSKESREKESGLYDALLVELGKQPSVADLELLQLSPLVADMTAAEAEFKRLNQLVVAEKGTKTDFVAPSKLKNQVLDQVNLVGNYLDTMSKAKPDIYTVLATTVSILIENLNQKIRRRFTHKPDNNENDKTK